MIKIHRMKSKLIVGAVLLMFLSNQIFAFGLPTKLYSTRTIKKTISAFASKVRK